MEAPGSLAAARQNSRINTAAITALIYDGKEQRRREITTIIESDPAFASDGKHFLSHTGRYEASIAKSAAFHLKCEALGLVDPSEIRWAYEAVDDILPTDVHMVRSTRTIARYPAALNDPCA